MIFSKRMEFERRFNKWAEENNAEKVPANVIAFYQIETGRQICKHCKKHLRLECPVSIRKISSIEYKFEYPHEDFGCIEFEQMEGE